MTAENLYGIDLVGGNSEYHTMVINSPLFQYPVFLKTKTNTSIENNSFKRLNPDLPLKVG